jgi:hypothetical protein
VTIPPQKIFNAASKPSTSCGPELAANRPESGQAVPGQFPITRFIKSYGNGLPEMTFSGPNVVTFKVLPLEATSTEK